MESQVGEGINEYYEVILWLFNIYICWSVGVNLWEYICITLVKLWKVSPCMIFKYVFQFKFISHFLLSINLLLHWIYNLKVKNTNFLIIKQKNFWRKFDQSQKKKYQISMKNFKEIRFQLNVKTFLLKKA